MSYTDEECNEIIELVREKNISDYEGQIAFAKKKGVIEIAAEMKKDELPMSVITKYTKLSVEEIEKL